MSSSISLGLSIVIPVFNSEQTLTPLVEQLSELLNGMGTAYEIILVNDCSRDGSWAVLVKVHPGLFGPDRDNTCLAILEEFANRDYRLTQYRSGWGEVTKVSEWPDRTHLLAVRTDQ